MADSNHRRPLTAERVLDAALDIIDEKGLSQLSMRKLGARLGVEAMTLYHHVTSKDVLLDRLVARVAERSELGPRASADDWREGLRHFANAYRSALLERPNLLPLIATRPVRTASALARLETGLGGLTRAGFSPSQGLNILTTIAMFTVGHALAEVGRTPGHEESQAPQIRVKPQDFPLSTAALFAPAITGDRHQILFDFGLEALLEGYSHLSWQARAGDLSAPVA